MYCMSVMVFWWPVKVLIGPAIPELKPLGTLPVARPLTNLMQSRGALGVLAVARVLCTVDRGAVGLGYGL